MVTIAGGIILAFIVICLLPLVFTLIAYLVSATWRFIIGVFIMLIMVAAGDIGIEIAVVTCLIAGLITHFIIARD